MLDTIKRLCKERGINSISELERVSGLKPNTIGKWDRSKPSYDKVKAVANSLCCDVDELMNDESTD